VPLYEYECSECGRFERIQKFSDPALDVCPTCGGRVQKLLSAPAIQFKGTGWYITDYARKGNGNGKPDAAKGSSETKGADSAKSDAGSAKTDSGSASKGTGSAASGSGSSS